MVLVCTLQKAPVYLDQSRSLLDSYCHSCFSFAIWLLYNFDWHVISCFRNSDNNTRLPHFCSWFSRSWLMCAFSSSYTAMSLVDLTCEPFVRLMFARDGSPSASICSWACWQSHSILPSPSSLCHCLHGLMRTHALSKSPSNVFSSAFSWSAWQC